MPVFQLNENAIFFPGLTLAREDGLLAVGGDLSAERLLLAYTHGIFPWYSPGEEILWWFRLAGQFGKGENVQALISTKGRRENRNEPAETMVCGLSSS